MKPDTTIVGCIEEGVLGQQCLMLVESIRRFGGEMSNVPVRLYRCRHGRPLDRDLTRQLEDLGAAVLDRASGSELPWWPHFNKPVACAFALQEIETRFLTFLDSDVLVCGDFSTVVQEEARFVACPEALIAASTGPGDEHEGYWQACGQTLGIDPDQLGWVDSVPEGRPIRSYWNSGVFTVDRDAGIIERWREFCVRLHHAKITSPKYRAFFVEQTALAFAAANDSRKGVLPIAMNCQVNTLSRPFTDQNAIPDAVVLHYHKSMSEGGFSDFVDDVARNSEDVAQFVRQRGPFLNQPPGVRDRIRHRVLKAFRNFRQERFYRKAVV